MEYKDRNGNMISSSDLQENTINFLYTNKIVNKLMPFIVKPTISRLLGRFFDTKFSTIFIEFFSKINCIDLDQYEKKKYTSFNDFFIRKIKNKNRPINYGPEALISPCDGKALAFNLNLSSEFEIKSSSYKIETLLRDRKLARKYENGLCLIIRLSVDDYHRYCYIDDLKKTQNRRIKGVLHSVHPQILHYRDIYKENSREYSLMRTKNFGDVIQVEVGALFVARIVNHHDQGVFNRGEEKGYFEFGGSTIVLLFEDGKINLDKDIIANTKDGFETAVKFGERIGTANK